MLIDPFKSKDSLEYFNKVAQVAGIFVAKYLYTLSTNGVSQEVLTHVAVNLTSAVISQLLQDPLVERIRREQQALEELDPADLLPN